jgi:predicted TIM-barrel fold metal-dependent hydrolase
VPADHAVDPGIQVDRTIPFIETHHHLWELDRFPYHWLDDPGTPGHNERLGDYRLIRTNWGPQRFFREFYGQNVIKSVHVEADYNGPDPARHLAASDRVRGVRIRGHPDDPDAAPFRAALAALQREGLSYELNASPGKLLKGRETAIAHPHLQLILGHAGFPTQRDEPYFQHWAAEITALAEVENVACKVSGLGMVDHDWTIDSLRPWVLHCIHAFGVDRVMFGTNWPVDILYRTYLEQVDAYRMIIAEAGLSRQDQERLLYRNAERFYRI